METTSRAAAAAIAVCCLIGVTACGTQKDEADQPEDWKPWLTSFVDGSREDVADTRTPMDEEYNGCLPLGVANPTVDKAVDTSADKAGASREELLRCSGTAYRDEVIDVRDGSHQPKKDLHYDEADFAHQGDIVLTHARPGKDGSDDKPQEPYLRTVYALNAETREEVWSRETQSWAVYSSGSVIGDERTKLTWPPGSREDVTPDLEPGGDLISWDAKTGEEQWRIETPNDEWCRVAELDGNVYVTCEDDQSFAETSTWYLVNQEKRQLEKLTETGRGGEHSADLTAAQNGELIFTPGKKGPDGGPKDYQDLVRLDVESGERTKVRLPKTIQTDATAIVRGEDIYFEQREEGGKWMAVDANTGKERWTRKLPFDYPSRPAVNTERDEVYFTDPSGRLVAYDRMTGEKLWQTDEARAEDGGTDPGQFGARGSVAVVEDVLVVSVGNTTFSVSPDAPEAEPEYKREVPLGD